MPVADLAAPDSALFLWATFPQLPDALRLIEAWGFTYKSVAFVWLKKNKKADILTWSETRGQHRLGAALLRFPTICGRHILFLIRRFYREINGKGTGTNEKR